MISTSLSAYVSDNQALHYKMDLINENKNIQLKNIKQIYKKQLDNTWTGYLYKIEMNLLFEKSSFTSLDYLFVSENKISTRLRHPQTNLYYKYYMYPNLTTKHYDKSYLVAGKENAKYKLLIFSNPLSFSSIHQIPNIIKEIEKSKNMALYIIEIPLLALSTSKELIKASLLLKDFNKNIYKRIYAGNIITKFDPFKNKNIQISLDAYNKATNSFVTKKQLNNASLVKKLNYNIKLANLARVVNVPMFFLNNKVDPTQIQYKKYLK